MITWKVLARSSTWIVGAVAVLIIALSAPRLDPETLTYEDAIAAVEDTGRAGSSRQKPALQVLNEALLIQDTVAASTVAQKGDEEGSRRFRAALEQTMEQGVKMLVADTKGWANRRGCMNARRVVKRLGEEYTASPAHREHLVTTLDNALMACE